MHAAAAARSAARGAAAAEDAAAEDAAAEGGATSLGAGDSSPGTPSNHPSLGGLSAAAQEALKYTEQLVVVSSADLTLAEMESFLEHILQDTEDPLHASSLADHQGLSHAGRQTPPAGIAQPIPACSPMPTCQDKGLGRARTSSV